MTHQRRQHGFTLVEMAIAAAMLVIVMSLSMRGFIHVLSGASQQRIQTELDVDVQTAMERIKKDMRLTSVTEIFLAPYAGNEHSAISFPLARDDDGDGQVDLDADGAIIWDRTLIYHVWEGTPNQLRLTVFDPRDNDMSEEERQKQTDYVLLHGKGEGTYNGQNASTSVVFENLFDWNVSPSAPMYDAYAPDIVRDVNASLGTCILSPGAHTVTFKVEDKNPNSSGYNVGVDYIVASPSYSVREAEAQLPVKSQYGAVAQAQFMEAGSWSGNYQVLFPATAPGHGFSLNLYNDCWEETNFDQVGQSMQRTTAEFNKTMTPKDFIVELRGMETNWLAALQTGDTVGTALHSGEMINTAVRVLVAGGEMENGGWISCEGERSRVNFRAGRNLGHPGGLVVWGATIAEANSTSNVTMDAIASTMTALRFGGAAYAVIPSGSAVWSDYANFRIKKEKSYLVSFATTTLADWGDPWMWENTVVTNSPCSFIIPRTSTPTYVECSQATWSSRSDIIRTNAIYGVQALFASYPTNGTYASTVFDTQKDVPSYATVDWNSSVPGGASITMKVRTGNLPDMSDAGDWNTVAPMGSPGPISPSSSRYVQFQATLYSDASYLTTPKLKDVRIEWPGDTRAVDVGGTFTKGPDFGVFQVLIDGKPLQAGVRVNLTIFEDARGYGGKRQITSALTAEVQPLNTWR